MRGRPCAWCPNRRRTLASARDDFQRALTSRVSPCTQRLSAFARAEVLLHFVSVADRPAEALDQQRGEAITLKIVDIHTLAHQD